MENRRIIHYNRNSIKARKLSIPSVMKRMRMKGIGIAEDTNHRPPIIDKVYATKNCMWCPADFDRFRIVCNQCRNCQYCGMVSSSNHICNLCGNHLPHELREDENKHKQVIRFF